MITMTTDYVLYFYFSGEVPQQIILNERDQVNVINHCVSEKAFPHLLLGSREN